MMALKYDSGYLLPRGHNTTTRVKHFSEYSNSRASLSVQIKHSTP